MKRNYFVLIALVTLVLSGCRSNVNISVSEPAAVFLEKEYETAGIINRTYSSGAGKVVDVIDNALSLEGNIDHLGSKEAVQGVYDELSVNNRFKSTKILDSMVVPNKSVDAFPAQIPWDEVQRICNENDVQLLFVLEYYDTDTKVDYSTENTTQSTPLGDVPIVRHRATMRVNIRTGWRIYDPKNKWIRDQFWVRDVFTNRSQASINPAKALGTLLERGQYVKQYSHQLGRFYAGRVENQRFRVNRKYYNKGSRLLKMGGRRGKVNDWAGAAELWEKETKSSKSKVSGRACYNMAIWAEIQGDLYGARDWAMKAYTDYRIRPALDYANLIRRRIQRWEENQRRKEIDDKN